MKTIIAAAAAMALMSVTPIRAYSTAESKPNEVTFVRAVNVVYGVDVQFVSPRSGALSCVVLGHEGQPIATGLAFADIGALPVLGEITADEVGGITCRYGTDLR